MKTTLQILKEARELISVEERWCRGAYARDRNGDPCEPEAAVSYCAIGAIDLDIRATVELCTSAAELGYEASRGRRVIVTVNDELGHAHVLRCFDHAIAKLEAEVAR